MWSVNFGDEPATTNQINGVVDQETHGLVPALFPAPLPTSTRTVLSNTVYLKARWQQPFPAANPAPFHTAGGGRPGADDEQHRPGGQLPPGGRLAVGHAAVRRAAGWPRLALLPPAHAASCAAPTAAQWTALTTGTSARPTGVRLPRLQLSQTWDNLQTPLAAMGLPLTGDYSGLGPAGQPDLRDRPADTMDVTPAGTTAAAATGVAVGSAERVGPR